MGVCDDLERHEKENLELGKNLILLKADTIGVAQDKTRKERAGSGRMKVFIKIPCSKG